MKKAMLLIVVLVLFSNCSAPQQIVTHQERYQLPFEQQLLGGEYGQMKPWQNDSIQSIRRSLNISANVTFYDYLDEFIYYCEKYSVPNYRQNFSNLKIDFGELQTHKTNGIIWGITRYSEERTEITINWIAAYDETIERINVFHELAHAILDHDHICESCCDLMAKGTRKHYELRKNWNLVIENLFTKKRKRPQS